MSFTHVTDFSTDSGSASFSITPSGVGDFIIWSVINNSSATSVCTGINSSGGNISFSALGSSFSGTTNAETCQVFIGKVNTAAATTLTFNWSGTTPAAAAIQSSGSEFSNTLGFSAVTLDTQGHLDSTGTNTWPSLTPGHGSGELYWGYFENTGAFAGTNGNPTGFTYVDDNNSNGIGYNPNCPNSATGGIGTDGGSKFGIAVQVFEATGVGTGGPPQPGARQWRQRVRPAQQVPQMQPVSPPPALPGGIPQPGSRFWQTTWRKAQTIPQAPANPAAAPAVPPPLATPPRIVRPVQRAIGKGQPGGTNPGLGVTPSDGLPRIPHPQPARAIGKGEPGTANHAFASPPLWQPQPRPRPYQRAIGKGQPGGTNQTPPVFTVTPPLPQPRPRPFQRVLWKGGAGPGNHGIGETPSAGLPRIPHPQPYRAVWRNGAGPPNHAFANPPLWQPQPRRPGPVRAIGNGVLGPANQSFTFVAVGPPLWQPQPRRPGPVRAIGAGNTNEPHLVAPPVLTKGTEFGDDESRRGWLKKRFVLEAM